MTLHNFVTILTIIGLFVLVVRSCSHVLIGA